VIRNDQKLGYAHGHSIIKPKYFLNTWTENYP
jgi:hypothetical protein